MSSASRPKLFCWWAGSNEVVPALRLSGVVARWEERHVRCAPLARFLPGQARLCSGSLRLQDLAPLAEGRPLHSPAAAARESPFEARSRPIGRVHDLQKTGRRRSALAVSREKEAARSAVARPRKSEQAPNEAGPLAEASRSLPRSRLRTFRLASFTEITDNIKDSRWSKMKNICIPRAVAVVVVGGVAIASLIVSLRKEDECTSAASEHGRHPCPPAWIWYNGKCYCFSAEERNWTASQAFCSSYNASLAIIEKEEMEFVLRYKGIAPHWIGFRRDPKQPWKWTDGNNSTLEVIGDGGDCAFLNGDATASSSRCSTAHHWICSKPDGFTRPKMV